MSVSSDSLAGFTSDFNVVADRFTTDDGSSVLTLAAWRLASGQDGSSVVATEAEVFVDPGADDYHLRATGPAVDGGTTLEAPPTDLEGFARPLGPEVDAGAFEHCPAGSACMPVGPPGPGPTTPPPGGGGPPSGGGGGASGGGGGGGGGCALRVSLGTGTFAGALVPRVTALLAIAALGVLGSRGRGGRDQRARRRS